MLASLADPTDEAAVFTFDTQLDEVTPFTAGLKSLPGSMSTLVPFGATSLHDAIAQTARRVATREGRHRAVVVFTDGNDNASRLTPSEVSSIAASIDVPVYIVGIVPSIDNPTSDTSATLGRSSFDGPLSELADWTGGHVFVVSSAVARSMAARQIVDELRHEYLIAFESSGEPGWHPLVIRAQGQGSDRSSSKWLCRWAISPDVGLGGSIMLRKFFIAVARCCPGHRRFDRLRHQEVREDERRRSQREGGFARPVGRGDAAAHAPERGARSPRSIRRPRRRASRRRRPTSRPRQPIKSRRAPWRWRKASTTSWMPSTRRTASWSSKSC